MKEPKAGETWLITFPDDNRVFTCKIETIDHDVVNNFDRSKISFVKKLCSKKDNRIKKLEGKYETSLFFNWVMGVILIGTVIFVLVS